VYIRLQEHRNDENHGIGRTDAGAKHHIKEKTMASFTGEVKLFAGSFAPQGWAFCHGQLLQIADHMQLYSLIGVFYGGDGVTTFALPDLRGRTPVGSGPGWRLGAEGGSESVVLSPPNMPGTAVEESTSSSSQSSQTAASSSSTSQSAQSVSSSFSRVLSSRFGRVSARKLRKTGNRKFGGTTPENRKIISAEALERISSARRSVGVDTPEQPEEVEIMQPYVVLNYIICIDGEYPAHS
jgi:microcystin-dependent protein